MQSASYSGRILLDIPCKVCQDHSSGKHYGIFACDGCAGFFKRSIRRNRQYVCKARGSVQEGKCPVDKTHRNQCRACRLGKCVKIGMNRDAVQHERGPRNSTLRRQMALYFSRENTNMMSSSGASSMLPPQPLSLMGALSPPRSTAFPLASMFHSPFSNPGIGVQLHPSALFGSMFGNMVPVSVPGGTESIRGLCPTFPSATVSSMGSVLPFGNPFGFGMPPSNYTMPPTTINTDSGNLLTTKEETTSPCSTRSGESTTIKEEVDAEIDTPSIHEQAARLLFMLISWLRTLPQFTDLSKHDQLIKLNSSWVELFLMVSAQYNLFTEKFVADLTANSTCTNTEIKSLKDAISPFTLTDIDEVEYSCLRAIDLLSSSAPLCEQYQLTLSRYQQLKYPHEPLRYVRLLMLLQQLKNTSISPELVEKVFFKPTIGNVPLSRLIGDLFCGATSPTNPPITLIEDGMGKKQSRHSIDSMTSSSTTSVISASSDVNHISVDK